MSGFWKWLLIGLLSSNAIAEEDDYRKTTYSCEPRPDPFMKGFYDIDARCVTPDYEPSDGGSWSSSRSTETPQNPPFNEGGDYNNDY